MVYFIYVDGFIQANGTGFAFFNTEDGLESGEVNINEFFLNVTYSI